jgi:hypothetical protein
MVRDIGHGYPAHVNRERARAWRGPILIDARTMTFPLMVVQPPRSGCRAVFGEMRLYQFARGGIDDHKPIIWFASLRTLAPASNRVTMHRFHFINSA